jgi:hypothetical protein
VPTHVVIDRDGLPPGADPPGFVETEDYVEVRGSRILKPFVEKPSNADDHNIYIYYPHSMGGGVKRLFRKVSERKEKQWMHGCGVCVGGSSWGPSWSLAPSPLHAHTHTHT